MTRSNFVRNIPAIAIVFGLSLGIVLGWAGTESTKILAGSVDSGSNKAITVKAAGRGNPFVNFREGIELNLGHNASGSQPVTLTSADFDHPTGLLYNDYIHVMYQARCILTGRGAKHKKTLYDELKTLTDKTNYVRIYDLVGKAT